MVLIFNHKEEGDVGNFGGRLEGGRPPKDRRPSEEGKSISPIRTEGRAIARTFWGKAWCDNLEAYSDFENRLPRGRTYVRNGSVIDLQIGKGEIAALVSGSSVYTVEIAIRSLERTRWKALIEACAGQIDSLVELLQGRFARGVMEIITCKQRGLFRLPSRSRWNVPAPTARSCVSMSPPFYMASARAWMKNRSCSFNLETSIIPS